VDSGQIENKLKDLTSQINHESFLFDLLTIYDFPKATLFRLKKGDKKECIIFLRKKFKIIKQTQ